MAFVVAFGNPVYDDITTPLVSTGGRVLSGCSTNGCLMLGHLGHRTALVGRIGNDFEQRFLSDLSHYGIEAYVERAEQSGGFRLVYDARGDRTLEVLGHAGEIQHVPAACADADAIIVGPILQETPLALIERIRRVSSAPLFLDPQGFLRRLRADNSVEHYASAEFAQIAPLCHVVKANELEAYVLTGIHPREDAAAAARRLRSSGCQVAIVTLAEAGSVIDDGTQQYHIPAYATEARDPTGAGDTYMAGFLHAYLQQPHDLYTAGCTGSATASIWIEHTGPDAPVTAEEVMRRLQTLRP
ncbi:MAG: PfkB family carbohydrate kinase [Chloroflexaceae bacterium]|jgi:sugar/nucleoside kinase (ribokinase family)|nr:PfkB family carbohydrate kinase [Chloroflexaceae bacterium]